MKPQISPTWVRLFTSYSGRYVRRHFHGVRVLKSHSLTSDFVRLPVVVFLNHASWWDPLICLLLASRFFPGRTSFAPIDAQALRKYGVLKKLGFFGVETSSARGAATFLRTASTILESRERMLWMTPQGRFNDVRVRPVSLQRGLASLAGRADRAVFLPLAIEYTWWEERLPEVLIAFGTPLFTHQHRDSCGAEDWNAGLQNTLEDAQNALAEAAQRREGDEWELLLGGAAGTTPVYDLWRRTRALFSGEEFRREHSTL